MTVVSATGRAIRRLALPGLFALTACGGVPSGVPATAPSPISSYGPRLPETVDYDKSLSELESLAVTLLLLDHGGDYFDPALGKRVVSPNCVALTEAPDRPKATEWAKDVQFPSTTLIDHLSARSRREFTSVAHCYPRDSEQWFVPDGRLALYLWVERVECQKPEDRRTGVWCLGVGWHSSAWVAEGYTVRAERDGDRFHLKKLESWTT